MIKFILITIILSVSVSSIFADVVSKPYILKPLLGTEFGKLIVIKGKIVTDDDTRLRSHLGKALIEVTEVGDKKLKEPLVIELSVFTFTDIKVPIRGTEVTFRGYETGAFSGIPQEAFKDIPLVASTIHHFKSYFQITKVLKPKK